MTTFRVALTFAALACTYVLLATAADTTTKLPPTSTTAAPSTDRSFSIESSNAPNTQFEWDAVQCLSEAYLLHPGDLDTITETYGKLYQLKHAGIWRVNAACSSFYVSQPNITIVVTVTEGTKETPIALYNEITLYN